MNYASLKIIDRMPHYPVGQSASASGWRYEDVLSAVAALDYADKVRLAGWILAETRPINKRETGADDGKKWAIGADGFPKAPAGWRPADIVYQRVAGAKQIDVDAEIEKMWEERGL